MFRIDYPLNSKKKGDATINGEKDGGGSVEKATSPAPDKRKAEQEQEVEAAKKEEDLKDLMGRFKIKNEKKKDTQASIALQAGWESSIGEVIIFGKITQDFGKPAFPSHRYLVDAFLYRLRV